MNQNLRDDPEQKKTCEDAVMLKRISTPWEQAGAVVFFLSDYSSCAFSSLSKSEVKADFQMSRAQNSLLMEDARAGSDLAPRICIRHAVISCIVVPLFCFLGNCRVTSSPADHITLAGSSPLALGLGHVAAVPGIVC